MASLILGQSGVLLPQAMATNLYGEVPAGTVTPAWAIVPA
jgi:hypothetical protein